MPEVHFNNMMGIKGMCQSIKGSQALINEMEKMMPKLYKDPQHGPCADWKNAKCKTQYGSTICSVSPYGASQDTVEALHDQAADLMWGGKGHTWAHADVKNGGKEYCMQVDSPKVEDDAKWRKHGDHWAKRHGTKIEDGKCGAGWTKEVHHWDHGKTHASIWMH